MEETKKDITCKIRKSLENKISEIYFFGSFFSDSWNPENSDVDLICVDSSFEEFPYFENIKYVKNALSNLPYKFDVFIYTPTQFKDKTKNNPQFLTKIRKAMNYDKIY